MSQTLDNDGGSWGPGRSRKAVAASSLILGKVRNRIDWGWEIEGSGRRWGIRRWGKGGRREGGEKGSVDQDEEVEDEELEEEAEVEEDEVAMRWESGKRRVRRKWWSDNAKKEEKEEEEKETNSLSHTFTHSLTQLLITCLLSNSLTYSIAHSHSYSLTHSVTHPLTHLLFHLLSRTFAHLLTHSFILSLTLYESICTILRSWRSDKMIRTSLHFWFEMHTLTWLREIFKFQFASAHDLTVLFNVGLFTLCLTL